MIRSTDLRHRRSFRVNSRSSALEARTNAVAARGFFNFLSSKKSSTAESDAGSDSEGEDDDSESSSPTTSSSKSKIKSAADTEGDDDEDEEEPAPAPAAGKHTGTGSATKPKSGALAVKPSSKKSAHLTSGSTTHNEYANSRPFSSDTSRSRALV